MSSTRLDRVSDWYAAAAAARFQPAKMAKNQGVSERTLRRYFKKRFGCNPKAWVDALRFKTAATQIARGDLVKTAAVDIGLAPANLTRLFKRIKGINPKDLYAHPTLLSEPDKKRQR